QNIWLIPLEFGWAQLRLERMLFEIEKHFWSWRRLSAVDYLQKTGTLEKLILDGMRRLRSVLDIIPFRTGNWSQEIERNTERSAIVQAERMVYKLWRQFFVAGAYYSSLVSYQYSEKLSWDELTKNVIISHTIPSLSGVAVNGGDAARYRERWKLW